MTKSTWIIFAVICVALVGGLIWTSQGSKTNIDDIDVNAVQAASEANGNIADHTIGNPDAKVVIIEYSDYQCPGCAVASPNLKTAAQNHGDDVLLIFRNFAFLGGNSRAAAAAAEAAGMQGKFWEMSERLFSLQSEWKQASLERRTSLFSEYANQLGLDVDKFETDLTSAAIEKKIDFDKAIGQKVGVTGTPGIFVNGKQTTGSFKDGEIVPEKTEGAQPLWSSAEMFEKHIILPALKEGGVEAKD